MATNIFDTSKNTINVTSVTDENVYGFDDSKNKIDVTGNLITEIIPVAGQTYWVDGIECVCFYGGQNSVKAYTLDDGIHLIRDPNPTTVRQNQFIDKKCDFNKYMYGGLYNPTVGINRNNVIDYVSGSGNTTFEDVPCYGLQFAFTSANNRQGTITDGYYCHQNAIVNSTLITSNNISATSLHIDGFRVGHSQYWFVPNYTQANAILMYVNLLENLTEDRYITSYVMTRGNPVMYYLAVIDFSNINISTINITNNLAIFRPRYRNFNVRLCTCI